MDNFAAICSLLLASYLVLCILKPASLVETILFFYQVCAGLIVFWGYILSLINRLDDLTAWAIAGAVSVVTIAVFVFSTKQKFFLPYAQIQATAKAVVTWYKEAEQFHKILLSPMVAAVLFSAIFNLIIMRYSVPHNWDSMAYHLARAAYYLQQGNLEYFNANYWAQVVHPKNSTILLIYSLLVSDGNEKVTQLIQYASYWVFVCSIYGISRKIGLNTTQSIFSALVSALLIEGILQATTTQNDMIIAAYFGIATYCLFAFRENRNWIYPFMTGLGVGLAIGTKASSLLVLPSVALIAVYTVSRFKQLASFGVIALFGILLFTLPSGYVENIRIFGHPMGPAAVRQIHSFEGNSLKTIAIGGTYNLLRYGFDFLTLDGLPPTEPIQRAQNLIRFLPEKAMFLSGIDLESGVAVTFFPFVYDRLPSSNEEHAYWGVLGFGLVWLAVLFSLLHPAKNRDVFFLSIASILFLLLQAYTNPYDLYRGRYFMICAVFAAPVTGLWLTGKNKLAKSWLVFVIFAGSVSAISAAYLKTTYFSSNNFGVTEVDTKSLLAMNRDQQFVFNNQKYYPALEAFNELVPGDAVVAVFLYPNSFEYPLFGWQFTRTLIPINSFYAGPQPIPEEAEYLLYARGYPCAAADDKHLGADWFLRKLDETNRACSYPSK